MKDFINNHPYITAIIAFGAFDTISKVVGCFKKDIVNFNITVIESEDSGSEDTNVKSEPSVEVSKEV